MRPYVLVRPGASLLLSLLIFLAALSVAAQEKARVYGRVLLTTTSHTMAPQGGAAVELQALAGGKSKSRTFSDSRGFYAFYNVVPGTYRIRVLLGGDVGNGSVVKVPPEGVKVPDLSINWSDPCRTYYGLGFSSDYVRTKINCPWRGDSIEWLGLARKAGWRTGTAPAVGAIAVFRVGSKGHLGWVESVAPDRRTFTVSQWDEPGPQRSGQSACPLSVHFGVRTQSTWRFGDSRILGFIYPSQ